MRLNKETEKNRIQAHLRIYNIKLRVVSFYPVFIIIRFFCQWSERPGFNPRTNPIKDSKNGI